MSQLDHGQIYKVLLRGLGKRLEVVAEQIMGMVEADRKAMREELAKEPEANRMRLTKTYSDGTYGVADDLPCGENSHAFKKLVIDRLGALEEQSILLTKEREANIQMRQYHIDRIEHWKQFRKEFKDGSYSLSESCEIRIDTHQVALKMMDDILEGNEPNEG